MAAPVYVVEGFRRWMRKQPLRELDLCRAVAEMTRGLVDADLGSGLVKKRIGRSGAGKRSGYRVLVARRNEGPWFFVEGYAKNQQGNVEGAELRAFQRYGLALMTMSSPELLAAVGQGKLKEVNCDEETEVSAGQANPARGAAVA
ncbi:type II toxin-antitoxin system RelE/ParE family toxin [Roseateles chitosanitabidus]|uniref:type II toxin-antitoxin system RelE/ParE family toxin n=1 Tax=Roseateles chitosanitabidus TaxID=65048 RepID=UPI0011E0660E|nr:type II toxin-antitoxin system RelE/ParE family toxin [Roseateles chitosanitabidus]MBO9686250.1 type II toxin-antitoxin system RelE/ParE family toxin [Roseateles chitosanitabidus]